MDLSVGNLGLSMEDGPVYECSTVKFGPNSQDKLVWKHVDQDGFHFVPVVGRTSYCPENHQICGASLCKKWQPNVFLHCIPFSVTHGYTIHHNSTQTVMCTWFIIIFPSTVCVFSIFCRSTPMGFLSTSSYISLYFAGFLTSQFRLIRVMHATLRKRVKRFASFAGGHVRWREMENQPRRINEAPMVCWKIHPSWGICHVIPVWVVEFQGISLSFSSKSSQIFSWPFSNIGEPLFPGSSRRWF